MGIAKNINAVGEYDFYSLNYKEFSKILAKLFNVNFEIIIYPSIDEDSIEKENIFMDFGYAKNYRMIIQYYYYNEKKTLPENKYCTYNISVPIDLKGTNAIDLEFMPNNIFQLSNLPFNSTWRFFIEDINGYYDEHYRNHDITVKEILLIRDCYISILKQINCNKVVLWTDANYKTENKIIYNEIPFQKNNLDDIINNLELLDNVKLYDFKKAIQQKVIIKDDSKSFLDIAFIDHF